MSGVWVGMTNPPPGGGGGNFHPPEYRQGIWEGFMSPCRPRSSAQTSGEVKKSNPSCVCPAGDAALHSTVGGVSEGPQGHAPQPPDLLHRVRQGEIKSFARLFAGHKSTLWSTLYSGNALQLRFGVRRGGGDPLIFQGGGQGSAGYKMEKNNQQKLTILVHFDKKSNYFWGRPRRLLGYHRNIVSTYWKKTMRHRASNTGGGQWRGRGGEGTGKGEGTLRDARRNGFQRQGGICGVQN